MYHQLNASVAAGRSKTEVSDQFSESIQSIARRLFLSTPTVPARDRKFLSDLMRGEVRYPMRAVQRLTAIAQHSTRPEHREAFAEFIRKLSTCGRPRLTVAEAFDAETIAQGKADIAQREFERNANPETQRRLLDALTAQAIATRESIEAAEAVAVQ